MSSTTSTELAELGEVKMCLNACKTIKYIIVRKVLRSYLNEHFILEEALGWIAGIILLILVKKAGPAISGHKIFWVKIAYVSSMAVGLMPLSSVMTISAGTVNTRTADWTSRSPQDKSIEQSHHDRNHVQFFGQIRVLVLGLDVCA